MAALHIAPTVFPVPPKPTIVPPKTTPASTTSPARTPFSAVAPPRFPVLSRLQIRVSLETIHEEETTDEFTETSSPSSALFLSKNPTCSLQVGKHWPSYGHDGQCA
ncbi:hypothetical protein LOK49_LG09G02330 [Camellia lanceoleosa]|uniref:Uncharacterized protein n=1 Tax=Camellia lanceoleosa TaxID=1840588 RepID=A0ACC0GK10_9ERIC|nr:hypothetical protein LOK49_LG09G02330 [Camellia lanceoleosa]